MRSVTFKLSTITNNESQWTPNVLETSLSHIGHIYISSDINSNSDIPISHFFPTRLKITPSSQLLFITGLCGELCVLTRYNDNWVLQNDCVLALDLFHSITNTQGQRGLLSIVLSETFDENSDADEDRYIFLLYQELINSSNITDFRQVVSRYTLKKINNHWTTVDELKNIFEYNIGASAHQIMDGYCYENKLYFVQGDCFDEAQSQVIYKNDNSLEYKGKILSIDYDGNNLTIVGKGIRNPYTIKKLPKNIDHLERVLAVGNGHGIGRCWLAPISNDEHIQNFGWGENGDDNIETDGNGWKSFKYKNGIGNLNSEGVLKLFEDDPSVNGVTWCFKNDALYIFMNSFGGISTDGFSRNLWMYKLTNFENQPSLISEQILLTNLGNSTGGNQLGIEYDHINHSILFTECFQSSIYELKLHSMLDNQDILYTITSLKIHINTYISNLNQGGLNLILSNDNLSLKSKNGHNRGVIICILDDNFSKIVSYKIFDTYNDENESIELVKYIKALNVKTICLIGILDEGSYKLSVDAKNVILKYFHINIFDIKFRECFVGLSIIGSDDNLFFHRNENEINFNYKFYNDNSSKQILQNFTTILNKILNV